MTSERDLDQSPFAIILADLLVRIPGARAAVLVDYEGETVDYAGKEDPFTLRVIGAELGLVARVETPQLGALSMLTIRGEERTFVLRLLPDGYTLCLTMRKRSGFSRSPRGLAYGIHQLAKEAGWEGPPLEWHPVDIAAEAARPKRILLGKNTRALEVIGTTAFPDPGFRVRTRMGWEATLVREPGGSWYASEAP